MGHIKQVADAADEVFFVDVHVAVGGGHGPHVFYQGNTGFRVPVFSQGQGEFKQVCGLIYTGFQLAKDVVRFRRVQLPAALHCLYQACTFLSVDLAVGACHFQ